MTANQLRYQELQETKRSNQAKEAETNRSNLAKEIETARSNVKKELLEERSQDLKYIPDVLSMGLGFLPADKWIQGKTEAFNTAENIVKDPLGTLEDIYVNPYDQLNDIFQAVGDFLTPEKTRIPGTGGGGGSRAR